jgi:hypothetical protein
MFRSSTFALPLAVGALLLSTACGPEGGTIIIGDEIPAGNNMGIRDAAIGGQFGPFRPADRATRLESYDDGYWSYITIYADGLAGGNGTAFAMVDFYDGALDDAEPGTVYYSNYSTQDSVIFDDNGDTYVRVDEDTEVVESDGTNVALCGDGVTEDGEDGFFDIPADEVLLEVEELEDEQAAGELDSASPEDGLLALDDKPDLLVNITAVAWDRDEETGESLDTYQVANARFILPR